MSEPRREWEGEGRRFLARLALVGALAWGLGRYAATRPGAAAKPSSAALESSATGEASQAERP